MQASAAPRKPGSGECGKFGQVWARPAARPRRTACVSGQAETYCVPQLLFSLHDYPGGNARPNCSNWPDACQRNCLAPLTGVGALTMQMTRPIPRNWSRRRHSFLQPFRSTLRYAKETSALIETSKCCVQDMLDLSCCIHTSFLCTS